MSTMLPWVLLTALAYAAAVALFVRSGGAVWALPVVTGTTVVLLALGLSDTRYVDYADATRWLRWLSGPAVISLAVPLYRQAALLRRLVGPLLLATLAGCATSIIATWALASLAGLPPAWVWSLVPKSATMPIAMATAQSLGGTAALVALAVVVTGVTGTLLTPLLLRGAGATDERVEAFTLGLAAHAIGTAQVVRTQPTTLAFAALAMGLNGVATAMLLALWFGVGD